MSVPETNVIASRDELPTSLMVRWVLVESVRWTVQLGAIVGLFFVGWSWLSLGTFAVLWLLSALGITLCYHRYFTHRSFKTSRPFQFVMALWGATALQRGPVWWSAIHREHHAYSDSADDWHSPKHGFYHSHMGWLSSPYTLAVSHQRVPDLTPYRELMWLENWFYLPNIVLIFLLGLTGHYLELHYPALGTNAWQLVVWGFFLRVSVVWQLTFVVNSLLHRCGERRYETADNSRNGPLWFALITLGDAYHNNHHYRPRSARHAFASNEIDVTYWVILLLEKCNLVWDVKRENPEVLVGNTSRHGTKAIM